MGKLAMKRQKKPIEESKQIAAFRKAARSIKADEREGQFDSVLKRIAQAPHRKTNEKKPA